MNPFSVTSLRDDLLAPDDFEEPGNEEDNSSEGLDHLCAECRDFAYGHYDVSTNIFYCDNCWACYNYNNDQPVPEQPPSQDNNVIFKTSNAKRKKRKKHKKKRRPGETSSASMSDVCVVTHQSPLSPATESKESKEADADDSHQNPQNPQSPAPTKSESTDAPHVVTSSPGPVDPNLAKLLRQRAEASAASQAVRNAVTSLWNFGTKSGRCTNVSDIESACFKTARFDDQVSLFPIYNEHTVSLPLFDAAEQRVRFCSHFDRLLLCFGLLRQEGIYPYDLAPIIQTFLGNLMHPFVSCLVEYNIQYQANSQTAMCLFQINSCVFDVYHRLRQRGHQTEQKMLLSLVFFSDSQHRRDELQKIKKQLEHKEKLEWLARQRHLIRSRYSINQSHNKIHKVIIPHDVGANFVEMALIGVKRGGGNHQKFLDFVGKKLEARGKIGCNLQYLLKFATVECHCFTLGMSIKATEANRAKKVFLMLDAGKQRLYATCNGVAAKMQGMYSKYAKKMMFEGKSSAGKVDALDRKYKFEANFDVDYEYQFLCVTRRTGTSCQVSLETVQLDLGKV